ncbi:MULTISPECIES: hypothetical protein [unclassified Arthrobacter]|uniref:hypothetical protein n=1 Tax=unclassified Arthrobacter TaxID=235627 RepID=UPI001E29E610|nr:MULTISPECIES: hypothetical protein [unclassified Arthrobacter]MCC9144146.1 hypothetical protein [Arthrobacter sp. zg-Y919]MDK1275371.1 hypothetical protein [Arthrobacter sp. zg.Y919]WIB03244.1 hypothetical protein QNO10_00620 [Arthrobacter sp. zg-Y919]
MSIVSAIQYGALAVAAVFTLVRLPLAVQGRNPMLFWGLAFATIGVALSIPSIYLPVDALLGGTNQANLILRYATYGVVAMIGGSAAAAFRAPRVRGLILGIPGLAVLAATAITTTVLFSMCDLPVSSPGLNGYMGQESVWAYSVLGRVYPAYIAACLIIPAFRVVVTARPAALRIGSALIGVALVEIVVWSALWVTGQQTGVWDYILPHSAVIVLAAGLASVAFYGAAANRRKKQSLLTSDYVW